MAFSSTTFLINPHEARSQDVPSSSSQQQQQEQQSLRAHARRALRSSAGLAVRSFKRESIIRVEHHHHQLEKGSGLFGRPAVGEEDSSLFLRAVKLHRRRRSTKRARRMGAAVATFGGGKRGGDGLGEPLFEDEAVRFENLPVTIRRKYFSSLERLRLAEEAAHANNNSSRRASPSYTRPSTSSRMAAAMRLPMHRPSTSIDSTHRPHFHQHSASQTWENPNSLLASPTRRLRKRRPSTSNPSSSSTSGGGSAEVYGIERVDAQWFLNLPEAVKRKHFTREEQMLLAREGGARERELERERCEGIIVDAADEAFYRLGRRGNGSCRSLGSEKISLDMRDDDDQEEEEGDDRGQDQRREKTDPNPASREQQERNKRHSNNPHWNPSFSWMSSSASLDLKLDDYHKSLKDGSASNNPDPSNPHKSRKQSTSRLSFRKTLAFPAKHGKTESFSFFFPGSNASSRRQSLVGKRTGGGSISFGRGGAGNVAYPTQPPVQQQPIMLDTEAQYYQDPEARLKLRVYLASPQKFDEAIEFGFPSTAIADSHHHHHHHCHNRNCSSSASRPGTATATVRKVPRETMTGTTGTGEVDVQEKSFLFNDEKGEFEEIEVPVAKMDGDGKRGDKKMGRKGASAGGGSGITTEDDLDDEDDFSIVQDEICIDPTTSSSSTSPPPRPSTSTQTRPSHYRTISTANREMTLRMTLTRPDLRADENLLYGWQAEYLNGSNSGAGGRLGRGSMSLEPYFDGNWEGLGREGEKGFVKRVWRKVRRG